MSQPPPRPQPHSRARIPVVGRDERGHRDEVIRIGRVAQPEREREAERDEQRRAGEEAGEPPIQVLERPEQKLEAQGTLLRRGRGASLSSGERPHKFLASYGFLC